MQVVLVMFRPDGQRRSFPVNRDVTVIGRREDCDFRIPLSDVSRKHCRLVKDKENGTVRAEDLGSSNGTFINGKKVKDATIGAGDTLSVGPVNFVLQIDGAPADEELKVVAPGVGDEIELPEGSDSHVALNAGGGELDDEIANILNAEVEGSGNVAISDAVMDLGSDDSSAG